MDAIDHLIEGVVDYAGLFPPADLPLAEVVENYANYVNQNRLRMLGRLIVPAARLGELEPLLERHATPGKRAWKVSALIPTMVAGDDHGLRQGLLQIAEFNQRRQQRDAALAEVDAVEVKAETATIVDQLAATIPADLAAFLEVDWASDPAPTIDAIARHSRNTLLAKIRTGGVTQELIPDPDEVARFLSACARADVGFKATAGLHHPLRGQYRLTYKADADMGTMHGFLNVFVASCLAFSDPGLPLSELSAVLASESAADFHLSESAIAFRNHAVTADQIARIRHHRLLSFGSCSFEEPSRELEQLFELHVNA